MCITFKNAVCVGRVPGSLLPKEENLMSIRIAAAGLCVLACMSPASAQDRTETNFVTACLKSSNLSQDVCSCTARKAKAELSAGGFDLVVATLEGDEVKAGALRRTLDTEQLMKSGTFMTRGPAQCAKGNTSE